MRADVYLVERGVAASRTLARRLIEAGAVLLDGRPVEKPAQEVPPGAHTLEVGESRETRYVGRGGLKLEAALDAFPVPVVGGVFADIGASTGGFRAGRQGCTASTQGTGSCIPGSGRTSGFAVPRESMPAC